MFSSQLDAASEAHIARGYVPCTPSTLCLHPLQPFSFAVAPLVSRTDASRSHFAILNVRRLFIEIQYLQRQTPAADVGNSASVLLPRFT